MAELSDPFSEALVFAAAIHRDQVRKGTHTPYIAHLLGVAALVLEHGGTRDQAMAALLHDSAEDQGGHDMLEEIERRFGQKVADLVADLSDTFETPKPAWRGRKEAHLAKLDESDAGVLLIAAADKVNNAHAIVRDLRTNGPITWQKFKTGRAGTIWYYSEVLGVLERKLPGYLTEDLRGLVQEMRLLEDGTEGGGKPWKI